MRRLLLLLLVLYGAPAIAGENGAIPRQLLAFYDSRQAVSPRNTFIHRFLEMPANHLGYEIRYHDINDPLPTPGDDVRGIILWFDSGVDIPGAGKFLDWLLEAETKGKKIIILENMGISDEQRSTPGVAEKYHALMASLGLRDDTEWHPLTYDARLLHQDESLTGFERSYGPTLPPFGSTHLLPGAAVSHLKASPGNGEEAVDLIVTGSNGGYVAEGYVMYMQNVESPRITQWYIDPFAFLRRVLNMPFAPVPDVTTLNGKRIFYSHIDGDGWNNISEIPTYSKTQTLSAEVIRREVLLPYDDFAFNVGLITADVDPSCYGVEASEKVARDIFSLPNVEPSSHTHSHPLFWRFFANYSIDKERPYLSKYPSRPAAGASLTAAVASHFDDPFSQGGSGTQAHGHDVKLGRNDESDETILTKYYATPRSYACSPYNMEEEIGGSITRINALAPPGKKATLVQWSGDTSPYEEILTNAREGGYFNINGGDSRFDREYPSYAWVAPIGLQVGKERQIYSSNSNENTYTNLWTGRFFGFRYLQTTVENTEHPLRITPFNLYFHIYSGQKQASLDALKANLDYARTQDIIPITASQYAAIANGFYSTRVISIGKNQWKIYDRNALQTLRIDNAVDFLVSLSQSEGVLGYYHHQNNLYIALDPATPDPVITLINIDNKEGSWQDMPYLRKSNWIIKDLRNSKKSLTFGATGYGTSVMEWQTRPHDTYAIQVTRGTETLFSGKSSADENGLLTVSLGDVSATEPVEITLTQ